jgi:hypothetical protein
MVMWSECIWIRIGIGGGLLWIIGRGVFGSASPEDLKDVSHVVSCQGCTVYVPDTSIQIAATGLPSVGLCRVLASSDFHLFDPRKQHLGSHR